MNEEIFKKVREIREHLHMLHTKWANDPDSDDYHKSDEGYVSVTFEYPNWFEADDYLNAEPQITVSVYSYLFSPSRMHNFSSLDAALREVKSWDYYQEE